MGIPRSREKAGLDARGQRARHVLARGEWGGGGQAPGRSRDRGRQGLVEGISARGRSEGGTGALAAVDRRTRGGGSPRSR